MCSAQEARQLGTRGARGCAVASGVCRWWEMRLEHPREDPMRFTNKFGLGPENQEGGRIRFCVSGARSGFVRKQIEEGTARETGKQAGGNGGVCTSVGHEDLWRKTPEERRLAARDRLFPLGGDHAPGRKLSIAEDAQPES